MEKKLVLVGGGGHCKSVIDSIIKTNEYSEIVITDYSLPQGTLVNGCMIVGDDDCLLELKRSGFQYAFVTTGNVGRPNVRNKLVKKIESLGFEMPIVIDPTAIVSDDVHIGRGTFIGKNAIINTGVKIGNNCIINTGCIVEHESAIGDLCHIATGAVLCGGVRIGDECFIGACSTIIQRICIENGVVVGAGAVVTNGLPEWSTAVGIPAKVVKYKGNAG